MATKVGELFVRLSVDSRGVGAGVSQAERELAKFDRSLMRAANKTSALGRGMAMGLTLPLVGIGVAMTKLASDAQESASKMQAVFGDNTKSMNKWIAGIQSSIPATTKQLHDLTSGIQDLLVPLGMAPAAAMALTKQITVLAGDLASFNNIGIDEALQRIRSGLVGQYEPLLKFGVALNATTVKAEAVRLGLHKGTGELNANARAQVGLQMIMARTTAAHGDAARTADSAANQFKFLARDAKEAGAEFGQVLLPAVMKLVGAFKGFVSGLNSMDSSTKTLVATIGLLAAAIGPLLIGIGAMVRAFVTLRAAMLTMAPLMGPGSLILAGLALIGVAFYESGRQADAARTKVEQFKTSLEGMGEAGLKGQESALLGQMKGVTARVWASGVEKKGEGVLGKLERGRAKDRAMAELGVLQGELAAVRAAIRAAADGAKPGVTGGVTGGVTTPTSGGSTADEAKKAFDNMTGGMRDLLALQDAMKEAKMSTVAVDNDIYAAYLRINDAIARGVALTNAQKAAAISLRTELGGAMAPMPANVGMTPHSGTKPTFTVKGSNTFDSKDQYGNKVGGMFPKVDKVPVELNSMGDKMREGLEGVSTGLISGLAGVASAMLLGGGGKGSQIGGGIGGAIGGVLTKGMSVFGASLGPLGAVAGGMIGSFIGGFFDKKPKKVANGLDVMATQLARVNQQLRNMPSGYRVAAAQFGSTTPVYRPPASPPPLPDDPDRQPKEGGPGGGKDPGEAQTYIFNVMANSPAQLVREVERAVASVSTRGGPSRLALAGAY